jgi:catecholate siderophore receptor
MRRQGTNAPAGATNAPAQLPDVVVSGERDAHKPEMVENPRYTEPLRDIPQSISVIPRALIREQNATTLRDVLRNVSGITMQAGEGGGGLPGDNLSIRGFNARNDIFLDGVRDYGSFSRDTYNTEQVEVYKGPTSATAGRGSAGGAVNIISKRPGLRPLYFGDAGIGTDDYMRFSLDVNQPLKGVGLESSAVRLNGMFHDADTPGRDEVTGQRWGVAPSYAFGLGTQTRITLMYQHLTQDNVPDYGIPWVPVVTNSASPLFPYSNGAPPVDYDNFYGLRGYDFEDIQNDVGTAILDHDVNDFVSLRNLTRFGESYRNSAITAPRFFANNVNSAGPESLLINRQLQRREMRNQIAANQTDLFFRFDTGPITHGLVGGFELSREEQDNRNSAQTNNQPATTIFDPNPGDNPLGSMPEISAGWTEATADTVALYLADTLHITEKWEVLGGIRYDHINSEFRSLSALTNSMRNDDLVSWRGGLVFKPLPIGSIYIGYGTAFVPSLEGNTGISSNLDIDPEESHMFEIGTKWEFFEERLLLSSAIFRNEKFNARTPDVADPTRTVVDGDIRVDGFEFEATGRITPEWAVRASYTFMDGEILKSNNPAEESNVLGNTPDHSFSLWSTYRLPFNLELGGGASYTGDRRNNNTDTARIALDYWAFDATAAYYINDHFTVRLNVYNIADEDYIDRVGGGHFVPGAGRSATLTASVTY